MYPPFFMQLQGRSFPPAWSINRGPDRLGLEDDDDIRDLLDRAHSDASSTGTASLPRPATSGDGRPGKTTRSKPSHTLSRLLAKVEACPAQGKGLVRRPHTAGAGGRARSLERTRMNSSHVLQLRREMLIRSHGEGSNLHLFPAEPFETTAMGRKACCADPTRTNKVRRAALTTDFSPILNNTTLPYVCRSHLMSWARREARFALTRTAIHPHRVL